MESMVQRVVRQAQEANLTNDITLATNASQLDIIQNQLGERVSVVTEPERRDTFPAIALAASYLKLKKNVRMMRLWLLCLVILIPSWNISIP